MKMREKSGFTLLELSIVLVIIGLIIGGITVGQSLIRAAELNSVISDVNRYKTAVNAFRLKYNGLPGDISNAASYWPACDDNDDADSTCNGDANGFINEGSALYLSEPVRAWQHLTLAEVVNGNFTGDYNGGTLSPGVNMPESNINGYGYQLTHSTWTAYADVGLAICMVLEYSDTCGSGSSEFGMLRAVDAVVIDTKMDDGVSSTGKVYGAGCNTSNEHFEEMASATGDYDFQIAWGCEMMFVF